MRFKPPFLDPELRFKTSRSGGKGGQNVNKVATKVLLEFSVADSQLLSEEEKHLLLGKLSGQLNSKGVLQVVAQEERSQLGNKEIAVRKLYALINKCFAVKKKRVATKPSRSSVEERLKMKKKASALKNERKADWNIEE